MCRIIIKERRPFMVTNNSVPGCMTYGNPDQFMREIKERDLYENGHCRRSCYCIDVVPMYFDAPTVEIKKLDNLLPQGYLTKSTVF